MIADLIEDKEFGFGTEVTGVRNSGKLEIALCALSDRARVHLISFLCHRFNGIRKHAQSRFFKKGVNPETTGVWYEQHVRFIDRRPAAKAGGIEADARLERVFIELIDRHGNVMPTAG